MKPIKYCPTCGDELNSYPLLDIYLKGYSCSKKHFFFEICEDVHSGESEKANEIKLPANKSKNDFEIIEYFLTNKKARAVINKQIAVMLRRIYEISKEGRHIDYEKAVRIKAGRHIYYEKSMFIYCPICKEHLAEFQQQNIWVKGLRCNNSHEYYERGGTIDFKVHDEFKNLSEEMSDETLIYFVDAWLKNDPLLDMQLHDEMKRILRKYKEQVSK
jgi:hypothetical protein